MRRSPDRVTLHDIAREARVSVATASRALNGGDRKVSEEAASRVTAAAEKLRYVPNLSARAMKKGTSSTVGLIVGDVGDPYFAAIASGVIGAAKANALTVTVTASERSAEAEFAALRVMRQQGHRAIIVAGSRACPNADGVGSEVIEELDRYERAGGAVVFVSQPTTGFSTVALDNVGGARSLAVELAGLGYRSYAVLAGDPRFATVNERLAGFRTGVEQAGLSLPDERIFVGSFDRDGGYAAARSLIETGSGDVDAVFATSDVMAIGAMAAFRDAGVEVGVQLGLAGFDDIRMAGLLTPGLTTVAAPMRQLGEQAVELAITATGDRVMRELPTAVVVRESTPSRGHRRAG